MAESAMRCPECGCSVFVVETRVKIMPERRIVPGRAWPVFEEWPMYKCHRCGGYQLGMMTEDGVLFTGPDEGPTGEGD